MSLVHKRDDQFDSISSLPVTASVNSEREQGIRPRKIRVRFKNTKSPMLYIVNLQQIELRC